MLRASCVTFAARCCADFTAAQGVKRELRSGAAQREVDYSLPSLRAFQRIAVQSSRASATAGLPSVMHEVASTSCLREAQRREQTYDDRAQTLPVFLKFDRILRVPTERGCALRVGLSNRGKGNLGEFVLRPPIAIKVRHPEVA